METKRDHKGRFVKGGSSRQGGRPKVPTALRELALEHGPEAFRRVVALTDADEPRVALAACQEVLNRAYGKPLQSHLVDADLGGALVIKVVADEDHA